MTSTTLRSARNAFFAQESIPEDTYEQAWARVDLLGFPMLIPNTASRARSLRVHDLHHILTGYGTDLIGEAEIGAWELATGPRDHYVAWLLDLLCMLLGLVVAPRRVLRAWQRGCRSTNLYVIADQEVDRVLDQGLEQTRAALGLVDPP